MRLIDADALWAEFMELADTSIEFDAEGVANAIANAPTVEAVEVKHGRWEQHDGISVCTSCHSMFDEDLKMIQVPSTFEMPIHCPVCGAWMTEGREGNGV